MPVLPLVHSRMIESGRSKPRPSAPRITPYARRPLILQAGFRNSHLAYSVSAPGSKGSGTSGVVPINSNTAPARFEFMLAILQPEFLLHLAKHPEREFKVVTGVCGRDLG